MIYMHAVHLQSIDANLLVALHHLLQERSVRKASLRLGLSPSATSHALARLRQLFNDKLLVRAGRELKRTARAEQLHLLASEAVDAMQRLLMTPSALQPALLERTFRISTTEYLDWVLLPRLDRRLRAEAPRVDLHTRGPGSSTLEELRNGSVDMFVTVDMPRASDLSTIRLMRAKMVTIVRRGHPIVGQRLTKKRFAELEHILVAPSGRGGGIVDDLLAQSGLVRRVARMLSNFVAAPHLVAHSDYVLTLPAMAAAVAGRLADFETLKPPLDIPVFEETLVWHNRFNDDPAHRWMRQLIVEECRALQRENPVAD